MSWNDEKESRRLTSKGPSFFSDKKTLTTTPDKFFNIIMIFIILIIIKNIDNIENNIHLSENLGVSI